jgi:hypothetical protein
MYVCMYVCVYVCMYEYRRTLVSGGVSYTQTPTKARASPTRRTLENQTSPQNIHQDYLLTPDGKPSPGF